MPRFATAAVLLACAQLFAWGIAAQSRPPSCGDDADKALFAVKTWRDLALYWERYPTCDDGYFGEHISELVGGWLSQRPTTIARLARASRKHPTLMPLVLRHINVISSAERLELIRENADRRCPGGSEGICGQILARLREIDEEVARERRAKR